MVLVMKRKKNNIISGGAYKDSTKSVMKEDDKSNHVIKKILEPLESMEKKLKKFIDFKI